MKLRSSLGLLLLCASGPLHAQLSVSPREVDFGERGHNESPTESILVTNSGTVSLTIREVKPSCGCIHADPPSPSSSIPPGSSVEIRLSMASGRAIGMLEKHLEISTVEGGVRSLQVPIRMRVFEGLDMEPRDLRYDGVVGGAAITQTVDLKWARTRKDKKPITATDLVVIPSTPNAFRMASAYFTTRVVDLPDGKRLEVTLLPSHPEGPIRANLEARVDGKLLVVPVVGEMFRHIKIVPTYFNFSRVATDDPQSYVKDSTLSSTDTRAFKIVSITPSFTQRPSDACKIEIEDTSVKGGAAGTEHVLRARIAEGEKPTPGSFSGKVIVKTDHPGKPEIILSFFGFFAEPKK